jgi:hypothetical protein
MDYRERIGDREEGIRASLDGNQAAIWTNLPGTIVSFDPIAVTASVQPTIQGALALPDGTTRYVDLPVIPDVPVRFPGGGGFVLTWPLQHGDECQIHIQARNMDSWWQQGGVQRPLDTRMHDLSDAICVPGPMSKPNAAALVGGVSTVGAQIRTTAGDLSLTFNSATGIATLLGDLHVTGEVIAGFSGPDQVGLQTHTHDQGVDGHGDAEVPTNSPNPGT